MRSLFAVLSAIRPISMAVFYARKSGLRVSLELGFASRNLVENPQLFVPSFVESYSMTDAKNGGRIL